jgi:carbon-monoxide dehydrogenase iron sulfur subunit
MSQILSINIELCTNCHLCESWCSFTHTGKISPAYSRIRLHSMEKEGLSVPVVCNHCSKAYCMSVCAPRALKRDSQTGGVLLDQDLCIGCKACIMACPFGAISLDPESKVLKCDLCVGASGPVCVARCPKKAIAFERPELISIAKQKAYSHGLVKSMM